MKKKLKSNVPQKPELPKYVVLQRQEWYVKISFPTKNTYNDGRVKYLQIKRRCFPETSERAAEVASLIHQEYDDSLVEKARPKTIEDGFSLFLNVKKSSVSNKTYQYYEYLFDQYFKGAAFSFRILSEVEPLDVQQFYQTLIDRKVSGAMVRKVHNVLSMMFRQAIRWKMAVANPTIGSILPKKRKREIEFFSPATARKFIDALQGTTDFIIFEFALETGMRPGEYIALTWSDIDLDRCVAKIRRAVTSGLDGGGYEITQGKTFKARRSVDISERLRDRLLDLKTHQAIVIKSSRFESREVLNEVKGEGPKYERRLKKKQTSARRLKNLLTLDLVFPNKYGEMRMQQNLNKRTFPAALALAKISSGYHPYSLRHTSATLLLAKGVDIKTIANRLGHADETQVLTTYGHVIESMKSNALEKMGAILYD